MSDNNPTEIAAVGAAALAKLTIKETVLAQFRDAETVIVALADRYRNVAYDVTTTKGMKDAIAARADLRDNGRLFVTKAETRIKAEVNDLKRVMSDEVDRLVAIVKPVEEAVDAQIKAEEQRKAAEKAERERIEAERVAAHRAKIDKLAGYATRAKGQPLDALERAIAVLSTLPIGPEYEEFEAEAKQVKESTIAAIRELVASERLRMDNERMATELAKLRKAQEEQEAKARAEEQARQQAEAEQQRLAQQEQDRIAKQAEDARKAREDAAAAQTAQVVQKAAAPIAAAVNDALATGTEIASVATESVTRIDPAIVHNDATIKLGQINERLDPLQVSAAVLSDLGFEPVGKDRSAILFRESDFLRMCKAISDHALAAMVAA